jgi:hypothetical protein
LQYCTVGSFLGEETEKTPLYEYLLGAMELMNIISMREHDYFIN